MTGRAEGGRRSDGPRGGDDRRGKGGQDSNGYQDGGAGQGGQRKRRNESDGDFVDRKRTFNDYDGGDGQCHLKILLTNMVAGAIIGKGAENIKNIQKESGVRIQISKTHDFYPGTQERVCLISAANADKVLSIFDFVLEKLFEKRDPDENCNDDEIILKLVIANSSAGMIIGKSGSHIKHIKETSGCHFLNISQKSDDPSLSERILKAIGNKTALKQAVTMVLEKTSEDVHGHNLDISYGGGGSGTFNDNNYGGSQGAMSAFGSQMGSYGTPSIGGGLLNFGALAAMQQFSTPNSNSVNLSINLDTAGQASTAGQLGQSFERIKNQLRQCGLSDFQIMEVYTALNTLAKYGVLGVNAQGQNDLGNKVLGAIGKVLEECLIQKTLSQQPPLPPPPMPDMSRFDGGTSGTRGGAGAAGGDRSSRWGDRGDRRN